MTPFYTAMDAAYDAQPIRTLCHDLGIVSLIDSNPRGQEKIPLDPAKAERYKSRSSVERVNSLLKEGFGGTACPGSGSREGVRASDVWNRGPDGHAASSSRDAVVVSGSALSKQAETSQWSDKGPICLRATSRKRFGPETTRKR